MRTRTPSGRTPSRKKQHVDLALSRDVNFKTKSTGLEEWEFIHNALPELNLSEVDPTTTFLHRRLSAPFMISSMTGGYTDALTINRRLAEVCEEFQIAMGVGSQRQALETAQYHRTFTVVREVAPSVPIVGNIGAAEVAQMRNPDAARRLVDMIDADALAVHLNPLQEFLQPEGNTDFHGVIDGIHMLVTSLEVPVIVKEIGAGISSDVAQRLYDIGVRYIDVAGAGGTSWAGVETLRRKDREFAGLFWDWGIPTTQTLRALKGMQTSADRFTLIASGGLTSGLEAAKCIGLGADIAASARPMLKALMKQGKDGLRLLLTSWIQQLRGAMFLTGSKTISALQQAPMVQRTRT